MKGGEGEREGGGEGRKGRKGGEKGGKGGEGRKGREEGGGGEGGRGGSFIHFMVMLMAGQREDPGRGAEGCCCSPCSSLADCGAWTTSAG